MKSITTFCTLLVHQTLSSSPDVNIPGHYKLWNDKNHLENLDNSANGCKYEDLPTEYTITSDDGPVEVGLNGHWNCTTRDVSASGRKRPIKDMCNLICDEGFGLHLDHLKNPDTGDFTEKYKMQSKRVICKYDRDTKTYKWAPAARATIFPRCHNTCGDLKLTNTHEDEDIKADMKCRNLGAINEDSCVPGFNCHHAATCYATCAKGFDKENTPKESNEMACICTQKKCGWKIPNDIGALGRCTFKMTSQNRRIIGGVVASYQDDESVQSQVSAGTIITNRKKRSAGENLIDHRRSKRNAQSGALKWQHICGGVLLTAQWAFTAAHCRTPGLRCVLGELDFSAKEGTETPCKVRMQIIHPRYDGMTYNDIMMMNIQCKKLKIGTWIYPAKLPRPTSELPSDPNSDCTVCGWGTMKYPEFAPATDLQCVKLPMLDRETCNQPYGGAIHDKIMCLGELGVSGRDSCQGDSGGGAYCNGICYGIVMGGLYCADENYPGVYTVISKYVPWAISVIKGIMAQSKGRGKKNKKRGRGRREIFSDDFKFSEKDMIRALPRDYKR